MTELDETAENTGRAVRGDADKHTHTIFIANLHPTQGSIQPYKTGAPVYPENTSLIAQKRLS